MGDQDYYKTLGVRHDASRRDIKRAYRKLAKQFHPDTNPRPDAVKRFSEINEAYGVLIDTKSRRKYDWRVFRGSDSAPDDQYVGVRGMQGIHGIPPTEYNIDRGPGPDRSPPGDPDADLLIRALSSNDWRVRHTAAMRLGLMKDNRAVDPLIRALSDNDHLVREAATRALELMGDKQAVEPLIGALGDDSEWVRFPAAKALGTLGDKRAVDPLIKILSDDSSIVREAAANALAQLGDEQAIAPLTKALMDENQSVRLAAEAALAGLGYKE